MKQELRNPVTSDNPIPIFPPHHWKDTAIICEIKEQGQLNRNEPPELPQAINLLSKASSSSPHTSQFNKAKHKGFRAPQCCCLRVPGAREARLLFSPERLNGLSREAIRTVCHLHFPDHNYSHRYKLEEGRILNSPKKDQFFKDDGNENTVSPRPGLFLVICYSPQPMLQLSSINIWVPVTCQCLVSSPVMEKSKARTWLSSVFMCLCVFAT